MAPWWPGTSLLCVKAPRKLVFLFTLSLSVTYLFYSLLSCYTSLQFPLQDAGIYLQPDSGLSPVDAIRTASIKPDPSNPAIVTPESGSSPKSRSSLDSYLPSSPGSSIARNGEKLGSGSLKSSGGVSDPLPASALEEFSNSVSSLLASSATYSKIRTLNAVLQPGWPTVRTSGPVQSETQRLKAIDLLKHKALGPVDSTVLRKSSWIIAQIPSTAVSVSTLDSTPIQTSQEFSTLDSAPILTAQEFSTLDSAPIAKAARFSTVDSAHFIRGQGVSTEDRAPSVVEQGFSTEDRAPTVVGQGFSTEDRAPTVVGQGFSTEDRAPSVVGQGFSTEDRAPTVVGQGFSTEDRAPTIVGQGFSTEDRAPSVVGQGFSTEDRAPTVVGQGFSTEDRAPSVVGQGFSTEDRAPSVVGQGFSTEDRAPTVVGQGFSTEDRAPSVVGQGFSTEDRAPTVVGQGFSTEDRAPTIVGQGFSTEDSASSVVGQGFSTEDRAPSVVGQGFSTEDRAPSVVGQGFSTEDRAPTVVGQRFSTEDRAPSVVGQGFSTEDRAPTIVGQGFSTEDRAPSVVGQGFSTEDRAPSVVGQGFSTEDRAPSVVGQGFSTENRAPSVVGQGFSTEDRAPSVVGQEFSTEDRAPSVVGQEFSTEDRAPSVVGQGFSTEDSTSSVVGQGFSIEDRAPFIRDQGFSIEDHTPIVRGQGSSTLDSTPIASSLEEFNTLERSLKSHLSQDVDANISLQGSAKVTKESNQQTFSLSTAIPSVAPRLNDFSPADTAPIHTSHQDTYMTRDTHPRIFSEGEITRPSDFTGNDMNSPIKGISTWNRTPLAATEMIPESHTGYLERETQESSTTEEELSRRLSVNSTIEYGEKKLPQAIIIGVKKGGTRALLEALRAHPDVRAVGVEPHFFDRNYEKGLEWYRDLMPRTVEGQITMEKTPSYFVTNEAPQRIHSMAKDTKLIVVVRNPVTRAISDYTQTLSKKPEIPTFEVLAFKNRTLGLIDASWSALRIGIYALHLESWMQYFPLSQILFVSGEHLITNPAEELAKVQDFLGLQRIITDKHFYFNKTKGFPCLKKPEDTGAPRCLGKSKGRTHPKIDPDVIQRLRKFYKPFNVMFYQMTGQDFQWEKEELDS
ncbi:uncharacterized protein LOC143786185 [Ranitomeya variabilis]|uniref:uncharacterized protein LOC143786185 n=1 Tax=Ranitomeya variabilis TaxID=490064 RepID=UPI004055FF6B